MIDFGSFYGEPPKDKAVSLIEGAEVQEILQAKIEFILRRVGIPPLEWGDQHVPQIMRFFSIEGTSPSLLSGDKATPQKGLVRNEHLQAVGLALMQQYGLSEVHHYHGYKARNEVVEESSVVLKNGAVQEVITYPSTTIEGLAFRRTTTAYQDENKIFSVKWSLVDEYSNEESLTQ